MGAFLFYFSACCTFKKLVFMKPNSLEISSINVMLLIVALFLLLCGFALGGSRTGSIVSVIAISFVLLSVFIFTAGRGAKTMKEAKQFALYFGGLCVGSILINSVIDLNNFHLVWKPENIYIGVPVVLVVVGLFLLLKKKGIDIYIHLGGVMHT